MEAGPAGRPEKSANGEIRGHDHLSPAPLFVVIFPMSRLARTVVADLPHHVTQRGNRREAIFFERYTNFINARGRWTGHLFQSRFASVAMDELHLLAAVSYLSLNPVRAGLVWICGGLGVV